jgi:hypothetical protein
MADKKGHLWLRDNLHQQQCVSFGLNEKEQVTATTQNADFEAAEN